ncbi:uncharacterized protein SPPG_05604 [Spizellomyces punctatus DAOM BR117]|uniref:Tyrosinase copper-binding domain-containing protein n=1 Tax=Spizellomyces punctatus (strain DAOM BR117) TaxID=645134 RepID=A0A0L0HF05_SPIPD|nr:uncharacterized protein SPPG_05604 [Spizellomyces punctatus DAOM BR117]KNC99358.1 hypothetical protein SPPG_05604 [Spizellomyces punctatus DAOM BR117]|eukprot:XP_016607398.1 hypothetical protein SPPG_05604 [Spizellomyces punctatus DAOM BR117]
MKVSTIIAGTAVAALALSAGGAVDAAAAVGYGDYSRCGNNVIVRKEVHDLTQAEWNVYMTTIQKAMVTPYMPNSRISLWEYWAYIHNTQSPKIHGNSIFSLWHRWFIFYVERELRKINPAFSFPYWATDRQYDSRSWSFDSIWNVQGRPAGAGQEVTGGAWAGARFTIVNSNQSPWLAPFKNSKIKRAYGLEDVQRMTTANQLRQYRFPSLDDYNNIYNMCLNVPTGFHCWANRNEWLHGTFHVVNGGQQQQVGQMATMFSPLDPLFYLHHSNIDRIYDDVQGGWNRAGKSQEYQIMGSCPDNPENPDESQSPKCLTLDTKIPGFNLFVRDTQFSAKLCVKYQAPLRGPPAARAIQRRDGPLDDGIVLGNVDADVPLPSEDISVPGVLAPVVATTTAPTQATKTAGATAKATSISGSKVIPPIVDISVNSSLNINATLPVFNVTLPSYNTTLPFPSLNGSLSLNGTLNLNLTFYPIAYTPPSFPAAPLPDWWIQMQYRSSPNFTDTHIATIKKSVQTIFETTVQKVLKGERILGPIERYDREPDLFVPKKKKCHKKVKA